MYEKYTDNFLKSGRATEKETYITLFNKLEDYNKFILQWEDEDLGEFIKKLESISVNSVNKIMQFIREFHKFVAEQEGVEHKKLELLRDPKHYINFNKLLEVTITENQYNTLRRLLTIDSGDISFNYRDAAILVLAWNSCTNTEIKNLMKDDIKFYKLAGQEKCEIRLKTRYIIIDDKEEINIIKKTLKEFKYFITGSDKKKEHFVDLRDTNALIRPVQTRQSEKETCANPSEILGKVFEKLETIPGTNINLYSMSIESIKRSRIINLLRKKNVNTNDIKNMFSKGSSCDLYWLEQISTLMERESKQKGS